MNPSDKLSLSTVCKGDACTNDLIYSWSLFVLENQGDETEPIWQRDNTTLQSHSNSSFGTSPNIILKKNVFRGDKDYKLVVMGTLPDGNYGRASYAFQVNAAPLGGSCEVEPSVGHVLATQYRFGCTGWHDPDEPLRYEIAHVRDTEESLLYYGGEANTTITLPLGDGDSYTMNIAVRIYDRLGAASLVSLYVKVQRNVIFHVIQIHVMFFLCWFESKFSSSEFA